MKSELELETKVAVIALSGKILGGKEATIFHGRIDRHLARGGRNFVIDLEKVDRVNSIGLGMLVSARNSITKAGGRMALANITNVESLLSLTRLATVLDSYDSRKEAIETLRNAH